MMNAERSPAAPPLAEAALALAAPAPPKSLLPPALALLAVLAVLAAATVAGGLWQLRHDALRAQDHALSVLATALGDELERGLQGVTVALQATRDDLRDGLALGARPWLGVPDGFSDPAAALRARAAILPLVRQLWVVDASGRVLASSGGSPSPPIQAFLPLPRSMPDDAVAISTPYVDGRARELSVALAMRFVEGPTGREGWVLAEVRAASLQGAYQRAAPGPDARMVVLRRDGQRLAGHLGDGEGGPEPQLVGRTELGEAVQLTAFDDGTQRLVQGRELQRFPVSLILTRDTHAVLARWTELAQVTVAATVLVMAVLALLLVRMLHAERGRRVSQQALQAELSRAALAQAAAQEGHWDWAPGSDRVYVSARLRTLLGLTPDGTSSPGEPDAVLAAHGKAPSGQSSGGAGASIGLDRLRQTLHPDDAELFEAALRAQEAGTVPRIDLSLRVAAPSHEDGPAGGDGWRWLRVRGTAARDATGRIVRLAGVAFDTTEERERSAHTRRLEAQLERARKLESLGTLAGGVAHDFNNILAAVVGYGEMAQAAAPEGSAQARQLDRLVQAAMRGKAVVARILAFSRSGPSARSVFAVQPVVKQVLELLPATLPARVKLDCALDPTACLVRGDPTQVFEAVMNLCSNALLAMPHGGTLGLVVQRVEGDVERWLSHGALPAGPHVRIAVSDSGVGIEPAVMERLFDPFFTTRAAGQGTGLGLTVVHGVVGDLGGAIDVSSHPGEGSRFDLYLPCVDESRERVVGPSHDVDRPMPPDPRGGGVASVGAASGAAVRPDDAGGAASPAGDAPLGQGQCVLVVDDEPGLVELAEELLAACGYEPVGCTDAHAALALLRQEPQRFDLLLTDELMPGLLGTELATQAREVRGDLPMLLLSGYGGPQLAERARRAGVHEVLAKPLQREALQRALHAALNAPRAD